jgi:hypothetical protein
MWRRARDYVDLCECAARFAEGRLTSFPGWGAPGLDAESQPLAALLAGLCRAGFLTTASQPGTAIARQGYQQQRKKSPDVHAQKAMEKLGIKTGKGSDKIAWILLQSNPKSRTNAAFQPHQDRVDDKNPNRPMS